MKPIRLEMSAFGSYAGLEVVDFTSMEQGIFLITGDTGAGKTTIFDAMMYALYDSTSGGRREGNMMRSQYAEDEQPTYVEFTFRYREEEYTIRRNPEYLRPGKRRKADGSMRMVKESSGVELTLPGGSGFMGKKRDIDRKIEEIIGLDAEQFRQVAMIAQGDFLKLLHAESRDRKVIFSKIFHTKIYWRIQEALKAKAKELYGKIEDTTKLCQREIDMVQCREGSAWEKEWKNHKASPEFSLDKTLWLLERIVEEDGQQMKQLEQQRKNLKEKSLVLEEVFRKLDQVKTNQKRIQTNEEQIQTLMVELKAQEEALTELNHRQQDCKKALADMEPQFTVKITRLKDSLEKYGVLERRQKDWNKVQKEQEQLQKKLEQNGNLQEQLQKRVEALAEQLSKLENLPIQKLEAQKHLEELERQFQQLSAYQGKLKQLELLQRDVDQRLRQYQAAQNQARKQGEAYDVIYQRFFQEQAGILASQLEEGLACPVCGSIHHPVKAVLSWNAPTQAQVQTAKRNRDKAEQLREQEGTAYMTVRQRWESQWETLKEQGILLLEMDSFLPNKDGCAKVDKKVDIVDKSMVKAKSNVNKIRQLEAERDEFKQELRKREEQIHTLKEEREVLEEARQNHFLTLSSLEKEIQLLQENLSCTDGKVARQELRRYEKELKIYRQEVEKASQEYEKNLRKNHVKTGEKKAREDQRIQLKRDLEKAKREYRRQLRLYKPEEDWEVSGNEPSLEKLSEDFRQLTGENKALESLYMKLFNLTQNNKKALRRLEDYQSQQGDLQREYTLYNDLNRTANGTLAGSTKVDFETYVQRKYFRQIIAAANRRLVRMNNQQFILQCRDMERLGTQGQVGLDLDVYHLVNNSARDVKTLSGGESFMAALAMALGLADIIQNEAGAIRLDTMFVDEGFGSLDDEARAQAIGVLLELADNQRLVGIISHVNELKEQIDHKLLVEKDDKGSHVRWG